MTSLMIPTYEDLRKQARDFLRTCRPKAYRQAKRENRLAQLPQYHI